MDTQGGYHELEVSEQLFDEWSGLFEIPAKEELEQ